MTEEIKEQLHIESITQNFNATGTTESITLTASDGTVVYMHAPEELLLDAESKVTVEAGVYWAIAQTNDLTSTVYSMGRPGQVVEPQLKMWQILIEGIESNEHLDTILNLIWRWSRSSKIVLIEEFYQSLQLVSTETAVVLVGTANDPEWKEVKNIVGWTKDFQYTLCPCRGKPANPHGVSAQILNQFVIDLPKSFISGGSDGVVTISGKLELGNMESVIQAYSKLTASFRHNGQSVPFVKGE